jgi:antitoxin VapB
MALSIKDPETDRLARQVSEQTGETITQAVATALQERLDRLKDMRSLAEDLNEIALRCAALPVYDVRTPDEIIGYDENGLPR